MEQQGDIMTDSVLNARIAAFVMANRAEANACADIAAGLVPDHKAARSAQDMGLTDCNRHTGWSVGYQGKQIAAYLTAQGITR